MTLTIGTGPFGDQGDKSFNFEVRAPRDHLLYFEDSPRRVRVVFGGETVADSQQVKLMHEAGLLPVYYFPPEDVREEVLNLLGHGMESSDVGGAAGRTLTARVNPAAARILGREPGEFRDGAMRYTSASTAAG